MDGKCAPIGATASEQRKDGAVFDPGRSKTKTKRPDQLCPLSWCECAPLTIDPVA